MYHIANTRLWTDCHIGEKGCQASDCSSRLCFNMCEQESTCDLLCTLRNTSSCVCGYKKHNDVNDENSDNPVALFATKASFFFMRSWTTSRCFCGSETGFISMRSRAVSSRFCADRNRYFMPKHDLFLTIAKRFFFVSTLNKKSKVEI